MRRYEFTIASSSSRLDVPKASNASGYEFT